MFAGTAATKIAPGHHNRVIAIHLPGFDESHRIERIRQADQGETAELFVLLGNSRNEVKILRRNNLVSIDVIPDDIYRTGKNRLHRSNVPCSAGVFNLEK